MDNRSLWAMVLTLDKYDTMQHSPNPFLYNSSSIHHSPLFTTATKRISRILNSMCELVVLAKLPLLACWNLLPVGRSADSRWLVLTNGREVAMEGGKWTGGDEGEGQRRERGHWCEWEGECVVSLINPHCVIRLWRCWMWLFVFVSERDEVYYSYTKWEDTRWNETVHPPR